jgi:uncharacterized protein (UPF0333 family)
MEEQKVYVVYKDGQVYQDSGKKIAYLQERYAKQLVTVASKKDAELLYEATRFKNKEMISNIRWYHLSKEEEKYWIDKAREHYEIKVFVEEKIL